MADYFLDSSALVKRYVTEPGSDVVDGILEPDTQSTRYIAETAIVEVIAALHRRGRRTDAGDSGSSQIARFRHELPRLASIVAVSGEVIQLAADLAARRVLRGYDAVNVLSKAELRTLPSLMIEALIAESVIPIAATGSFARMEGVGFLLMIERKVRWILQHTKHLIGILGS